MMEDTRCQHCDGFYGSAARVMVAAGIAVSAVLWIAVAAQVPTQSPTGRWTCTGTLEQGKTYTVDLTVEASGDVYMLEWTKDEQRVYVGFAFAEGDRLVGLFVDHRRAVGAITYRVERGSLHGKWSGGDGVFGESCLKGSRTGKGA